MRGHIAAQIARDAALDEHDNMYAMLSGLMCWDAVIACQVKAGMARPAPVTTHEHDHVISLDDTAVASRREMQRVPQGASVGFFRNGTLVHMMIATGAGTAAGNKNQCIGIGEPVGWEILDLGVIWRGGQGVHARPTAVLCPLPGDRMIAGAILAASE